MQTEAAIDSAKAWLVARDGAKTTNLSLPVFYPIGLFRPGYSAWKKRLASATDPSYISADTMAVAREDATSGRPLVMS
jgi:hypothetical protein